MRIAVISDIHGNSVALDAVLADLKHEAFDQMVCLGDAIQGGPQPEQVVARLRELGCPVVMGNADYFLLTGEEKGAEKTSEAQRIQFNDVRSWQLSQLTADDLAFIRAFQPTIRLPLDAERSLLCFHGSPKSFNDIILPETQEDEARQYLEPHPDTIYTGGHTHIQFIRHFGRTFHFNPGSVGLAYRHGQPEDDFHADPWAEYAVLSSDKGRLSLEFRRVNFDAKQLIRAYATSGRPHAESAIKQYEG
jgi:predicted phosphodiesterase